MNKQLKLKILYIPLFTGMMIVGTGAAYSQGTSVDFKSKIIDLEKRISGLEKLRQELQDLKKSLQKKEQKVTLRRKKLDKAIKSVKYLRKTMSVRESSAETKWHLAGYANVGFEAISGNNKDSFVSGKFNPVFHFQFKDWLIFESELEIKTTPVGETTIGVEYSQLDFLIQDNITLVVGKYLSPIGQFQERLHPSWINRSVDKPAGFTEGAVQPVSEVGVMLRGGIPVNKDFTFTYSLSVGNGPRFGQNKDELALIGFSQDNNSNKAIGGRLALVHISSLEVGFSYLNAGISRQRGLLPNGNIQLAEKGDYRLWGSDLAYSKGPWDVRVEYLNAKNSPVGGAIAGGFDEISWKAWYAQAAYRLFGISDNPTLGKIEPVIRYGEFTVKIGNQFQETTEKRWNIGVNYWLASAIVIKTGIERRNYLLANRADETRYKIQFAYGF